MNNIVDKVADCLVRAGSTFREDQKEAYRRAIADENNEQSCWVMRQVLDNALVAEDRKSPLCDDTGIPHLFLEVGPNRTVSGELLEQIKEGVAQGLRKLPGRPMAIKGDDNARIDQSGGLDEDSGALAPSPILIKPVKEDVLRLTVLMLGGGPAIRGITQRVFHKHSVEVVIERGCFQTRMQPLCTGGRCGTFAVRGHQHDDGGHGLWRLRQTVRIREKDYRKGERSQYRSARIGRQKQCVGHFCQGGSPTGERCPYRGVETLLLFRTETCICRIVNYAKDITYRQIYRTAFGNPSKCLP